MNCKSIVLITLLSTPFDITQVSESTEDMAKDMTALELFLSDKVNYEKHCRDISWDQPEIETYKEKLKSQLPEACQNRIPEEGQK